MNNWVGLFVVLASVVMIAVIHPRPQSLCFGHVFVVAGGCR